MPEHDVDLAFKETVVRALTKAENQTAPQLLSINEHHKNFCIRLLILWVLSNAGLALGIHINGFPNHMETQGNKSHPKTKQNIYLGIILYSTFGLHFFCFIGVCQQPSLLL
jgi:hypothetical protein